MCDEVLSTVIQKLNKDDDQFDIIGKNVAFKLRSLSTEKSIVAEKLINDILFEANVANITNYTKIKLYEGFK